MMPLCNDFQIDAENPTLLSYHYLSANQNTYSIDLLRLSKKRGILWNEDAWAQLRQDKNLSTEIKSKVRSDVIILFKEGKP